DHMYFVIMDPSLGRDAYEVRAIQDAVIYDIEARDIMVDTGESQEREWRVDMAHTCTFTSYFDLLTSIRPDIEAAWENGTFFREAIRLEAGELVGWVGAPNSLDFAVYDWEVVLPGFVNPSLYDYEPWKIHTVDPFPYFPTDVSEALLEKMVRTAEPRSGKIDHDINGRLAGNWFATGTRGYEGLETSYYWEGHLAIVPDARDPDIWRFSIGNYNGEAANLAIRENSPDPREVSVGSGMTSYELVTAKMYFVNDPDRPIQQNTVILPPQDVVGTKVGDEVVAVALVEMLTDRSIKVEVFPGLDTAAGIEFTGAARTY
ncbi:uncharacterized protein METZ01_LOCUS355406, partial [marine metagenome]